MDTQTDKLLPWPMVRERCGGLGRSTAWRMIRDGSFPAPVKIGAQRVGWWESEVTDWLHAQPRVSVAQQASA
jgi:prophage regulatory protein